MTNGCQWMSEQMFDHAHSGRLLHALVHICGYVRFVFSRSEQQKSMRMCVFASSRESILQLLQRPPFFLVDSFFITYRYEKGLTYILVMARPDWHLPRVPNTEQGTQAPDTFKSSSNLRKKTNCFFFLKLCIHRKCQASTPPVRWFAWTVPHTYNTVATFFFLSTLVV